MVLREPLKAFANRSLVPQCCASCEDMEACAGARILHGLHKN